MPPKAAAADELPDTYTNVLPKITKRLNDMYSGLDDVKIVGNVKIVEGKTILIIQCKKGAESWENCAYIEKGDFEIYTRIEELARSIIKNNKPSLSLMAFENPFTKLTSEVLSVGGIAGLIGLILTVTICVSFYHSPSTEIPDFFKSSLSAIIGFYFGSKTK